MTSNKYLILVYYIMTIIEINIQITNKIMIIIQVDYNTLIIL